MLKPLLDDGFGKADHSFLKLMAFVVVGMIMLRGVTNFISSYCLAWVSGKVVMIMRRRLFKHLMFMPVSFFDRNSTGKLLSRITYDSEMIANSSSNSLVTIVREGAYLISLSRGDVLHQLGTDVGSFRHRANYCSAYSLCIEDLP